MVLVRAGRPLRMTNWIFLYSGHLVTACYLFVEISSLVVATRIENSINIKKIFINLTLISLREF